jgi:hypothetical protein
LQTGGNQSQMRRVRKQLKRAKTVAVRCDRLPRGAHGKEGVSGSSPEDGFRKSLQARRFCLTHYLHVLQPDQVWSTFWNPQIVARPDVE